ncbi:glycosyltransferase [candidate division KSB1 bacterium]|nr:MAG: glycosyltransferase [candidate division KSB1 bacterium]
MCKYSIVIPVFNERDSLSILKSNLENAMKSISDSYEVILVDDGSTDGSREIIKKICGEGRRFRGIFFDKNYGQTAAFDAGFKAARGKVVITMDADLQYDPRDISLLPAKLGEYDVVCGYRVKRADPWIKRISSKIANFVRNKLSDENIRDAACSLKAFKKECLDKLKLYEGMHRFFPTLVKLEGYSLIEVPIHHYPRKYGVSKYNIRNRIFKSFRDLMAVRWMKKRYLRYKITSNR